MVARRSKWPRAPVLASVALVVADRSSAKAWTTERPGLDVLADDDPSLVAGRKGEGGQIPLCQRSEGGDGGTPAGPSRTPW